MGAARLLQNLPDSGQIAAATADLRTAFKQVKIYCEREEVEFLCCLDRQ